MRQFIQTTTDDLSGPLAQESEPEIWNAIRFGSILENVVFDEYTREVDFMSKYAALHGTLSDTQGPFWT